MRRQRSESVMRYAAIAAVILACGLAVGCGSASRSSSVSDTSPTSSPVSASQTQAQAAPSSAAASPSGEVCYTHSCIVSDAEQMTGTTASDGSVITKMSCDVSTVRHAAPGVFTVGCTATYTDGSQWYGIVSVLTSKSQLSWQPQYQT